MSYKEALLRTFTGPPMAIYMVCIRFSMDTTGGSIMAKQKDPTVEDEGAEPSVFRKTRNQGGSKSSLSAKRPILPKKRSAGACP